MRLKLELIPTPLWGKNLRTILKPYEWRAIRLDYLSRARNTCEICGAKIGDEGVTKLFCHEHWEYDDNLHVQKLAGLVITCFMCNCVNHSGMANLGIMEGTLRLTEEDLMTHFLKVNNCTEEDYGQHVIKAIAEHGKRGSKKWTQDISLLEKLYPKELLDKRIEAMRDMERGRNHQLRALFNQILQAEKDGAKVVLVTSSK